MEEIKNHITTEAEINADHVRQYLKEGFQWSLDCILAGLVCRNLDPNAKIWDYFTELSFGVSYFTGAALSLKPIDKGISKIESRFKKHAS